MTLTTTLLALCTTGCFYVDSINQRPSLDIRTESSAPVVRGGMVALAAVASDPEKHPVIVRWSVFACTDATVSETCDPRPVFTGNEATATFRVPPYRAAPDTRPVESLRIVLEGTDDRGAAARPHQELLLPVLNAPPSLKLDKAARYGAVVGTPIDLYARYADLDDTFDNVRLEWTAFSPSEVAFTLTDLPAPVDPDPTMRQAAKQLLPTATGEWDIRVVAVDRAGSRTEQHLLVAVVEDQPPCLASIAPLPVRGAPIPVFDPTLFQVLKVDDDRDRFPELPDAYRGTSSFAWSLTPPGGGPRQPLGANVSSIALDPAAYPAGSVLELRVEIFDRYATPVGCPDAEPTCAIVATRPTCLQRQTWLVEAR